MAEITEETDLHHRVLKRHYVEVDGTKWEVSTVRLIEEPENPFEVMGMLRDITHGIDEKYETMVFKIVDDARVTPIAMGATDFGHYRSNDSQDIVKAHDQIVSLIAEGKLIPVMEEGESTISKHILEAMMRGDPDHTRAPETNR